MFHVKKVKMIKTATNNSLFGDLNRLTVCTVGAGGLMFDCRTNLGN